MLLVVGLALLAVHRGALLEVPGPHHRHREHPALLTLDLPGLEHSLCSYQLSKNVGMRFYGGFPLYASQNMTFITSVFSNV